MKDKIIIHVIPEIRDLVPAYITHRKSDIPVIRGLLDSGNFEQIQSMGHKMKGGGNLYGLAQVSAMGDKIEKAAPGKDKVSIEEALAVLEDYLDRLEVQ